MKVIILGASGLLGQALVRQWQNDDDEIIALSSRDVDIRHAQKVSEIVANSRPDWIVLAAAYTDVDGCESHPDLASGVNRDGAVNVASSAKATGAKLIFLSSDYVFDGKKNSPYEVNDSRNPQSVYGRSKAEAEVRLLQILPECCIARTSWLFGIGRKCFPDTILKLAATRTALDVVNDQRGSPTYSVDLAGAIIQLCRKNATGIVHVTNSGNCTWFDLAREVLKVAGLTTEVRPVSSQQFVRPAPRPAYSVLSPKSLQQYDIEMPSWQNALRRYFDERQA
ncbi:MAG TPA: dTDP-4-dehydrorhamnose reductase [Candidatus Solibacter sp.]|nr:dTDP-4-dehydrorhamnose reductase [Candidatus Solibacter sp.]